MAARSKLFGAEVKRLQDALLSTFPTRSALAQMVRVGLEENLDAVAAAENLSVAVFELIRWAEAQGRLEELIAAARIENPGNPMLRAFAEEPGKQEQDPIEHVLDPGTSLQPARAGRAAPRARHDGAPSLGDGGRALNQGPGDQPDVLIVTAVKDEWDAVLAVDTGAAPGSAWEKRPGATGPEVFYRTFTTEGGVLRVAVVQAFGMGREQAVIAAAPLLERHPEVRCLAMCGVCAGRHGEVAPAGVIFADQTWPYDAGKPVGGLSRAPSIALGEGRLRARNTRERRSEPVP